MHFYNNSFDYILQKYWSLTEWKEKTGSSLKFENGHFACEMQNGNYFFLIFVLFIIKV